MTAKPNNRKPVESTEDFKVRLARIIGPAPKPSPEDRPCLRQPGDRGYYPPTRKTHTP